MGKKKLGARALFAAGAIVMMVGTPAFAAYDAGGGKWAYGVGADTVWSNYDHDSVNHSSSVRGGPWAYSGCTKPGPWSLASGANGGYNNAYYDKGCSL
ncbi:MULTISPECIES: lactococcin 972 family bacteriocin [unclassified Streptomyces]|uniref:lactococcin 972 family bacteriocin n=1 Tax=unclassified Streptomyces TaxID=2593676 RepID=UPI0033BEA08D|nr:lactococcin 972 family bacteriocin [Streptomyces sp. NBC_01653]WTD35730.1 lactococcin 972 family bacteriocin [Streptomyces sp. NBC_01643]WTD91140.1 lactococcin 972 family bacteriocin [Streptomyces sp. NBC_01637]